MDAQALALQFQLEETEWWPPEKLQAHQFRQIQNVIDHAQATVPFYRERLAPFAGWVPGLLTMERFAEIPILTRQEVQEAGKRLHARRLPPGHSPTAPVRTSGSTGRLVEVLATPVTGIMLLALTMRGHLWHQRDLSAKNLSIRWPRGGGGKPGRWAPLPRTGPNHIIDIKQPLSVLFESLLREDPVYLQSYPSIIYGLAQLSAETGRKPGKLRQVRTYGETLDPEIRELCREVWGLPMVDSYSAEEVNTIAHQCPETENLHVQSENVLMEVLDDRDRPCKPGESGRVVVTSLLNYATPLIRYELRDMVEVSEPCPCGRGLPALKRVLGRVRNLVTLPTGERYRPRIGFKRLKAVAPIDFVQLVQTSLDHVEVRIAADRQVSREEEERMTGIIQEKLHYPFNLTFTYHDQIARGARGKFEQFRSELPP